MDWEMLQDFGFPPALWNRSRERSQCVPQGGVLCDWGNVRFASSKLRLVLVKSQALQWMSLKSANSRWKLENGEFDLLRGGGVMLQRQMWAPWLLPFLLPKTAWALLFQRDKNFKLRLWLGCVWVFILSIFFFPLVCFVQLCFLNVCEILLGRRLYSPHNVLLCLPCSSSWFYAETPWTFGWAGRWVQRQRAGCRRGAVPGRTSLCTTLQPWVTRLLLQALDVLG